MPGGGILKLEFVQELGEIIKMKGVTGPFNYEINPGGSFITFQAAKELALDAVGRGEVHVWGLELEEGDEWEYEFQIVNGTERYEVEISGFELAVISIKLKGEDEDNDGDNDGEDEGDEEENIDAPEAVALFAQELFDGAIIQSEQRHTDSGIIWKLYLINNDDAVVKVQIQDLENDISLFSIEGEHGPFNYNIEPGMNLLNLT